MNFEVSPYKTKTTKSEYYYQFNDENVEMDGHFKTSNPVLFLISDFKKAVGVIIFYLNTTHVNQD